MNRIFIILLENRKYYILLSNQLNKHYILYFLTKKGFYNVRSE